jgi:ribonuclease J
LNNTISGPTPAEGSGVVDISDAGRVVGPNFQKRPATDSNSSNKPNRNDQRRRSGRRNNRPPAAPAPSEGQPASQQRPPRRDKRSYRHAPPTKARVQPLKGTVISRGHGEKLRIIPLGGSGEIGDKNMLVYEYDRDILIIDAGVKFPTPDMPGIDYVVCDTTYLEENRDRVRGFLITHGHEDHIGGLPYIWPKFPVPIYTAPLTAGFIKAKFEEHGIDNAEFRIIQSGDKIQIGAFTVEPVQMTHSIPDMLGLAITTPAGLIFHATDWKVDLTPAFGKPTDFDKLSELANRGVLCFLSDSTGVLYPGHTLSEQVVSKSLEDVFIATKGRLIVSSFSSRIDRLQHVATACAKTGRRLFLAGRSMERNANIAMELGYLKAPQGVLGDIRTVNSLPDDKVVVMCTGSQGEEGSALTRMSTGEHRHIRIKQGDTVLLSSSTVPGNERAVEQSINNLYRCGAEVVTKAELDIHSSGHGNREEIKHVLNLLKPKYLFPIHGDFRRFVEMRKLAVELGMNEKDVLIVENGQVVEFDLQGRGEISDEKVQVGSVLIDGLGVGDVGEIVLRDRQTMAADGVFLIIMTVDGRKGTLLTSPDIISRGFVYMKESEDLISQTRATVKKSHAAHISRTKAQTNWDYFKKQLRDDVGQFLFDKTQRRPMVIPVVIQV